MFDTFASSPPTHHSPILRHAISCCLRPPGLPRCRRQLARVPRTDGRWPCHRRKPAHHVQRNRQREVENAHPRQRTLVPCRVGESNLVDDRDRGRHVAIRRSRGFELRQDHVQPAGVLPQQAAVLHSVQQLCLVDAGDRRGPRLRSLRSAWDRGDRHRHRQDPLEATGPDM